MDYVLPEDEPETTLARTGEWSLFALASARMNGDDQLEELWRPSREELERDYVSLWELVGRVRRIEGDVGDDAVRTTVLALIARALDRSEVQAGTHPRGKAGLEHVWRAPTAEIITRIRDEWIALGRDPMPGEIVWLAAAKRDPGPV